MSVCAEKKMFPRVGRIRYGLADSEGLNFRLHVLIPEANDALAELSPSTSLDEVAKRHHIDPHSPSYCICFRFFGNYEPQAQ